MELPHDIYKARSTLRLVFGLIRFNTAPFYIYLWVVSVLFFSYNNGKSLLTIFVLPWRVMIFSVYEIMPFVFLYTVF
mgnify:CR=1 FL=1